MACGRSVGVLTFVMVVVWICLKRISAEVQEDGEELEVYGAAMQDIHSRGHRRSLDPD